MSSLRGNNTRCSVDGCKNNKRNKHLSFFALPADEETRNRWLEIIGRTDLIEKKDLKPRNYVVCSAHFEKDMIIQTPRLKPEALPTKYIPDVPTTCPDKTTTDGTTQTNLDVNITSDNKNVSTYKTVETQTDEARNDTAQTSIGVSTGILRKRKLRTGIQDPEENKRKLELVKKKIMRLQKIEKELEGDTSHSHSGW
ncbi:uncharacterized protein LOC133528417 isoform X1 [Cydia pomonella]|uniref:uncharacterized protein LOC133528417 isoform X1 n=1 Tax=Cydia pomonella TaxID=82600 RepID=UPI002ADDCA19|nr:uncharacterized protein LOC133528417 isoform X1 [Cydia pomonella]